MHNDKKILEVAALLRAKAAEQKAAHEEREAAQRASEEACAKFRRISNEATELSTVLDGIVRGEVWDIFAGKWVQCDANGKPLEMQAHRMELCKPMSEVDAKDALDKALTSKAVM